MCDAEKEVSVTVGEGLERVGEGGEGDGVRVLVTVCDAVTVRVKVAVHVVVWLGEGGLGVDDRVRVFGSEREGPDLVKVGDAGEWVGLGLWDSVELSEGTLGDGVRVPLLEGSVTETDWLPVADHVRDARGVTEHVPVPLGVRVGAEGDTDSDEYDAVCGEAEGEAEKEAVERVGVGTEHVRVVVKDEDWEEVRVQVVVGIALHVPVMDVDALMVGGVTERLVEGDQ